MNKLIFHIDDTNIPATDVADTAHIFLYGARPPRLGTGSIGRRLELAVRRLGVVIDPVALDFLSIALAVVAADTFVNRETWSANGWTRELRLDVPLARPEVWQDIASDLERALNFLSGDRWTLSFRDQGLEPPTKEAVLRHYRSHIAIGSADCTCLFSGGLDSLIGARQLADTGRTPLLVSHSYRGDQSYQKYLAPRLGKKLPRFAANANPVFAGPNKSDTTMRTRSLGFLAFGVVAANAVLAKKPSAGAVDLFVPENGFIALNAPLTRRRIGSHSTRTTHPNFLSQVQSILGKVGLGVRLQNPHRHMTKGEMLSGMLPNDDFAHAAVSTVSCGKWKRKSQQCGHCVPCLIRRAAFAKAGVDDTTSYQYPDLGALWDRPDIRDDVMAMLVATARDERGLRQRAIASGPLPFDPVERANWFGVHKRGLEEVASYLSSQGFGA
ncbi:Qat anti-phage system QueC-like protein QatC [Sinorhizobium fredii]|uniref:Qat anti-phage system QueC-like protein QatC n=1 Tax=Rhizobium fredii TaxID=380 RepID=UPI0035198DC1